MMCPACIASAATFAVGITSSGGVVAVVFAKVRRLIGFRKLRVPIQKRLFQKHLKQS
jgi:hypothetical protein